jgi:hypothetical protein
MKSRQKRRQRKKTARASQIQFFFPSTDVNWKITTVCSSWNSEVTILSTWCSGDLEIKHRINSSKYFFLLEFLFYPPGGWDIPDVGKKFSSYIVHQVIGRPGGQTAGKYGGKRATQTFLVNHGQPVRWEHMVPKYNPNSCDTVSLHYIKKFISVQWWLCSNLLAPVKRSHST